MPNRIKPPEYPAHFEVRQRFFSQALAGQYIGLEEVDDGIWSSVYYNTILGRIEERDGRITGVQSVKDLPGLLQSIYRSGHFAASEQTTRETKCRYGR